ncbi:hypothetical protein VCHC49A2_1056 [Vibrio cholerae HC-49A2]|nr:hypothetical protein VCHC49A2_1056 [Vibrio cholerae HC-49A2]EHH98857.1 hypothetical protein VCHC43A1_1852 [Vibrio cholerae HC-43A1]EJH49084.1 hypothetical protein VCHC20A2_3265 [Vibrio cholerae HC-20A2]EKG47719.1 hypothetical protein VCHC41A1_2866 [Vibrio cholerae HC-41A1]EKL24178.1 hypothetical protein VCHC62A1_3082 [Vibrio cholerae HC-62A1]EMQ30306.1 hypothetical protein VCEM1546_003173 [Vibrio cholerae O1 str. EM-1546]KKP13004.1 hypothetical protein VS85_01264 [Vibrio cholerae]
MQRLTCLLALCFAASASAKVTMEIPDTIDLLVVNGSSPKLSGGFFDATKKLELEDGEQQIVFRYSPYFSQGNDRIIIDSEVVIATFDAANQELRFDMPKYRDAPQATKAIKTMQWQLLDQQGKAVELRQDRLIKEGMQIGRNFEFETAEYNKKGGVAALTSSMAVQPIAQQEISNATAMAAAEEMLHFWYNKADAETKARFKAFVNQQ